MPNLFLSPSVQEYNPYINGLGSEEYYMNLVADAMEPYLISCGISFTRNDPDATLRQAIALSNAGNYDFHLALHSNAAHRPSPDSFKAATSITTPQALREHVPRISLQKT